MLVLNFEKILFFKGTTGSQPVFLSQEVEMDLRFILEKNLKGIIRKYASYVDCVRAIVEEKGVSPEALRSYLFSLSAFSSSYKGQRLALMSDREHELEKCNTITAVFTFLTTKCASFLNYDIFQDVIKKYNINDDREEFKYTEHIMAYIEKHKISEFVKINPLLKDKDGSKKLTLKYDIEYTCKLAKIKELKISIAEILDVNPSTLHIVDIEEGCVVVTFLISASVADAIFTPDTVFTSQQKEKLQAASVQWLKCNGHNFNFGKETENPGDLSKL